MAYTGVEIDLTVDHELVINHQYIQDPGPDLLHAVQLHGTDMLHLRVLHNDRPYMGRYGSPRECDVVFMRTKSASGRKVDI